MRRFFHVAAAAMLAAANAAALGEAAHARAPAAEAPAGEATPPSAAPASPAPTAPANKPLATEPLATEPLATEPEAFDVVLANRRAQQRIAQALGKPANFSFENISLEGVAERLEIELGVPVRVDRKALVDAGLDPAADDISFRKTPVSIRSALDMLLDERSLDWMVKHESLWITTGDRVNVTVDARVYDISDKDENGEYIFDDSEALIELITCQIAPSAWDAVGGIGTLRVYQTSDTYALVISQTRPVHEAIERLFADIRAARHVRKDGGKNGAPPPRREKKPSDEPPKASSLPADENRDAAVRGANDLAFDLYRQFAADNDKNCFFSPHSIATALAMIQAGATGQTYDEIAKALRVEGDAAKLHAGHGSLREALRGDVDGRGYELRLANRMWVKRIDDVEEPFEKTLSGHYGAELGVADFAGDPDAARNSINAWVADRTADRIRDLFAPHTIHNETRAALASAVYFKGAWSNRFEPAFTKPLPFEAPGERRRVPTMTQDERLPYAEIDGVQAVSLPYGSQDIEQPAAMLVLLPRPAENALASLEGKLSAEYVTNTIDALKEREVRLFLPKFTFHDTFDLRDVLDGVGIRRAFDPQAAEFDGITKSERLVLEYVVHQAFVQVDEVGTEAAAATGGGFGGFGGAPPPPKRTLFRADHPFVFLIYEPRTHSILFLGRVTSPPEA